MVLWVYNWITLSQRSFAGTTAQGQQWSECSQTSAQLAQNRLPFWVHPLVVRKGLTSSSVRGPGHWRSSEIDYGTYMMMPSVCYTMLSHFPSIVYTENCTMFLVIPPAKLRHPQNSFGGIRNSLPMLSGGLGVRSTTQLAPSAFLALAVGCAGIISQMLLPRLIGPWWCLEGMEWGTWGTTAKPPSLILPKSMGSS